MKNRSLYIIMVISLLVFLSIAFVFTEGLGFHYDQQLIEWTSNLSNPAIHQTMKGISLLGSSEVILLMTIIMMGLFVINKDWYHTWFFLIVSVGGVLLNFILKVGFQKERPGGEVRYIEVFNFSFEMPSYSFPSGHVMRSTILLLFVIYLSLRFIQHMLLKTVACIASIVLMIGVALSRIFLDAHFLSDTIGAISVSIVWFSLVYRIVRKFDPKQKTNAFFYRSW